MTKKEIRNVLLMMGVMPNMLGFNYITEGVKLISDNNNPYKTCELYKDIANICGVSVSRVERNIRTIFKEKLDFELPEVKKYLIKPNMANGEYLHVLTLKIQEELEEV